MIHFENDWRAGAIPAMLDDEDPRGAVLQISDQYPWLPFHGFTMVDAYGLAYDGDPTIYPVARGVLHGNEMILVYPFDWVAVVQLKGGSYEVARLD